VFAPVNDQERARRFWVEQVGFEHRADFEYSAGLRWVEVGPVGGGIALALVPPGEGRSVASTVTVCAFASADITADHARLAARGVDIEAIAGAGSSRRGLNSESITITNLVPPQCLFRDPDGNRFLLVQAT
jgi:catechol 2,3-dioxygenase-like lactoylglutathione lyase family enzyme